MLFKRTQPPTMQQRPTPAGPADDGQALEALITVFRAYGRFALDTDAASAEQTQALVEQWVRHVAFGQSLTAREHSGPRDWRAVARLFGEHRRAECESLGGSVSQLRDTVWAFVRTIHVAMLAEQAEVDTTQQQLQLLRSATERASTEDLRRVAESTLTVFDRVIAERLERQQRQQDELSVQLRVLRQELEEARRESSLDPLTSLPNRKEFDEFTSRVLQLHGFIPSPTCLLMIDLDGFKQLNDRFGHQLGDVALLEVAQALGRTFLRRCDFVCRYGGDEFAAIMRDTTPDAALRQADRLCGAVRALRLPDRIADATLSLSIGIADLRQGESVDDWMRRADRALYRAKDLGRDRAVIASD